MSAPQATWLPDGRRLHLHHGPIDLIVEAWGRDRDFCYHAGVTGFQTLLEGLVGELATLRRPSDRAVQVKDPVSQRMVQAVRPFDDVFVTPMAAVAGAVADHFLHGMIAGQCVDKAYVNNGGDIAFYLAPGQRFTSLGATGLLSIGHDDPARGIATSGWRGRSHSLGIADTVTVKARSAAAADVAATLIANAVDLPGHPGISRVRAVEVSPDSDLGDRWVTMDVAPLPRDAVARALDAGSERAAQYLQRGLITEATLLLQGQSRAITSESFPQEIKEIVHA